MQPRRQLSGHVWSWSIALRKWSRVQHRVQTGRFRRSGPVLRASVVSVLSVRREDAHDREQRLRKQVTEPPLLRRTDLRRAGTHVCARDTWGPPCWAPDWDSVLILRGLGGISGHGSRHGTLELKTPHPATESLCGAATSTNRLINYMVKKVTSVFWPFIVNWETEG